MKINYQELEKLSISDLRLIVRIIEAKSDSMTSDDDNIQEKEDYYAQIIEDCEKELESRIESIWPKPYKD